MYMFKQFTRLTAAAICRPLIRTDRWLLGEALLLRCLAHTQNTVHYEEN